MKYVASRLSEGNKIFPAEIHVEENGIKVRIPGFLSGDTRFIDYENISAVDINTPMIGFSTLTFFYQGSKAVAHGFKKEEARQIKDAIDKGKAKAKTSTVNHHHHHTMSYNDMQSPPQQTYIQPVIEPAAEVVIPIQQTITPIAVEKSEPIGNPKDNRMYSEQLENLIELALADGELTEKEKQVLFKKAEAAGIDLDEFEMVLDAKLFERNKNKAEQTISAAPKSDKFGDVKKCPACGAIVQSLTTRCSDCGHDFKNLDSVHSVRDFFRDYQTIESKVVLNEKNNVGGLMGKLIGNIESIGGGDWKRAVFTKKKEFIMHFPIPNSKEDILEFLSMAVPLATPAKKSTFSGFKKFGAHFGDDHAKNYDFMIAEVWMQKCEQLIMKSKFAMKDDKNSLKEVEYYANQLGIK